jgi:hypothetical protein
MRKAIAPMGIAVLAALVVIATPSASLAQAGANSSSAGKTDKSVSGGEAPHAPAISQKPPPSGASYGAAAVATFTNPNGDGAATGGVVTAGDPNTADSRAIQLCEKQGGNGNCAVVGRFRSGCGYLSVGGLSSDQFVNAGHAYWGFGATPQAAFAQCAQHMVGCGQAFGTCLSP